MELSDERLSNKKIISYSIPTFSLSIIFMTVAIYLPNYYTDNLGVTAGMLSWVFLIGRIWDAVTDPAMGHISDRTRTRWGRRRPYFLLSALPIWFFFYLIWSPNPLLSSTRLFVHLLVCYLLLYTFWTMFNIPHYSLGMELTPDYHERSRLFGGRQAFSIVGVIIGVLIPLLFARIAGSKLIGYSCMGAIIGGLSALLIILVFFLVKEREGSIDRPTFPFYKGLRITFKNRAFVILMLTYMISLVGQSFIAPLALYMAKYVLKADEGIIMIISPTYLIFSLLSIPLWLSLSKKYGKKKTWSGAMAIGIIGYLIVFILQEGMWLFWLMCTVPTGLAAGCTMVLGPSIQADVIDSDELETGSRREGAFIGVLSFVDKTALGIAVFIGLQGLELIGYVPNVEQTKIVITGIKFLYSILPGVLTFFALLIFQMFPMTEEVHSEIRAKLDAKKIEDTAVETAGS